MSRVLKRLMSLRVTPQPVPPPPPSGAIPRPFELQRDVDVSGVSDIGIVAEGVLFDNGACVLRWLGKRVSYVVWPSIADAMDVHGHGGLTRFVFLDEVRTRTDTAPEAQAA